MTLRVLVADDSAVVQKRVCRLLESIEGVLVVVASDGDEAVRLTIADPPDVVVVDYSMPGMNGIDAARLMRQRLPDLPVVLMTAHVAEYVIAAAFNAGIRGCVLASDAGDDLMRAIHTVLHGATFISPGASRVLYERYLPMPGAM